MITLIYIGDHFYHRSGTMMSPIYTEDGRRYDWGFVQRDLRNGREIFIRPATAEEIKHYNEVLAKIEREQ